MTTEDQAYEVKGAAGLFSRDYLFSLRSPLSVKAGEQVNFLYLLLRIFSSVFKHNIIYDHYIAIHNNGSDF